MDEIALLTEPRRREILRLIWDGERSAGDIAAHFDISFGAVSQHLARLRDAGFVAVRADGNHRYYRAERTALAPYRPMLEAMWSSVLHRIATLAEEAEEA